MIQGRFRSGSRDWFIFTRFQTKFGESQGTIDHFTAFQYSDKLNGTEKNENNDVKAANGTFGLLLRTQM